MKELAYLNKYFYKYKWQLIPGVIFVIISNYFGILPAKVIREAFDLVKENIDLYRLYDGFERQDLIYNVFGSSLLFFGAIVLALSLLRGLFLFLMRQSIILISRHIEYDLKNEIFQHYEKLSLGFYKQNRTGDLMNRISEDVSKVRMYIGPALMYSTTTITLFIVAISYMFYKAPILTLYAIAPLPLLSFIIYKVSIRFRKIRLWRFIVSGRPIIVEFVTIREIHGI